MAPLGVGPGVRVLPEGPVRLDIGAALARGLARGRALFVGVENARAVYPKQRVYSMVYPEDKGEVVEVDGDDALVLWDNGSKAWIRVRDLQVTERVNAGKTEDDFHRPNCGNFSGAACSCGGREAWLASPEGKKFFENSSDMTSDERAKFLRVARQALHDLGEEGERSSRDDTKDFIFSQLPSRLSHDEKESIADEALRGQRKNAGSCNCESIHCKSHDIDKGEGCKNPAGSKKVDMLGAVCDSCAEVYRKANPAWVSENARPREESCGECGRTHVSDPKRWSRDSGPLCEACADEYFPEWRKSGIDARRNTDDACIRCGHRGPAEDFTSVEGKRACNGECAKSLEKKNSFADDLEKETARSPIYRCSCGRVFDTGLTANKASDHLATADFSVDHNITKEERKNASTRKFKKGDTVRMTRAKQDRSLWRGEDVTFEVIDVYEPGSPFDYQVQSNQPNRGSSQVKEGEITANSMENTSHTWSGGFEGRCEDCGVDHVQVRQATHQPQRWLCQQCMRRHEGECAVCKGGRRNSAFCPNCDHDKNEHDTNGKCTLCDCLSCYPRENATDDAYCQLCGKPSPLDGLIEVKMKGEREGSVRHVCDECEERARTTGQLRNSAGVDRGSQKYGNNEGGK